MSFCAGAANGFTFGLINSTLVSNTNSYLREYNKESSYVIGKYPVAAETGKVVGSLPYMVVGAGEVRDTVEASTYTEKAADISYEIKDVEKVEGAVSDSSKAEKIIQGASKSGSDGVNKEVLNEAGNAEEYASSAAQYQRLKDSLSKEEIQSVIDTTQHGAERLMSRGFSPSEISDLKLSPDNIMTQSNGASVYIKNVTDDKFNVIVEGDNGVVTALKNISQKALDRLSNNYGWK